MDEIGLSTDKIGLSTDKIGAHFHPMAAIAGIGHCTYPTSVQHYCDIGEAYPRKTDFYTQAPAVLDDQRLAYIL